MADAVVLAPEAPWPLAGGGALRTASLLHGLARNYTLDVIVFREPGAASPCFPAGLARSVSVIDLPYHRRDLAARALRNAGRLLRRVPPLTDRFAGFGAQVAAHLAERRYELGVVEHFWCAPYVEQLAPRCARTVLDLHNVESVLHARCAAAERGAAGLGHRLFASACRDLERRWLPRFSLLLAASESDARLVNGIAPGAPVEVYPSTLPPQPTPPHTGEHVIVFSANFGYHPNIGAVRWFRREIWPLLRDRWPCLVWRLAGKNPEPVARYTAGDTRIEVTGAIKDAIGEIARAEVAVVPLLAGSGTRLKILEAWAAAIPVVSTTLGAEGLPARDGENILLADTPAAFENAVSRLLAAPELRESIGLAGRERFEREFTWETAWRRLRL